MSLWGAAHSVNHMVEYKEGMGDRSVHSVDGSAVAQW